jgi:hypothetical protein
MVSWTFLTYHARVLLLVAHDPGARLRDIAASLNITERSAFGIITDLAEAGYLVKEKNGRRNRYRDPGGGRALPGHRGHRVLWAHPPAACRQIASGKIADRRDLARSRPGGSAALSHLAARTFPGSITVQRSPPAPRHLNWYYAPDPC